MGKSSDLQDSLIHVLLKCLPKGNRLVRVSLFLVAFFVQELSAQNLWIYTLNSNYREVFENASPLIPRPNSLGQTGTFNSLPLPLSTCSGIGVFSGLQYAENAGFEFRFPFGTAGCEYSIQFTWNYNNLIIPGLPPLASKEWIRIISFDYTDDSGLNVWTPAPSLNGSLYYWHLSPIFFGSPVCFPESGALSPANALNTTDFYQMTFTRTCDNEVLAYVNGVLLGSYNDDEMRYMPQPPLNRVVFFRDTTDLSCYPTAFPDQASSGFIKDLRIANYAFTGAEIAAHYASFCPTILDLEWSYLELKNGAKGNRLSWNLLSLEGLESFEVQRRAEREDFQQLQRMSQIQQQTSAGFDYTDRNPPAGKNYYRIKAIDINGEVYYSDVKEIVNTGAFSYYPNPARDQLFVEIPDSWGVQKAEILDAMGRSLKQQSLTTGLNTIDLSRLPAGTLFLRLDREKPVPILRLE